MFSSRFLSNEPMSPYQRRWLSPAICYRARDSVQWRCVPTQPDWAAMEPYSDQQRRDSGARLATRIRKLLRVEPKNLHQRGADNGVQDGTHDGAQHGVLNGAHDEHRNEVQDGGSHPVNGRLLPPGSTPSFS